jgi:post-segregation antitoxin (ccd killing protein)
MHMRKVRTTINLNGAVVGKAKDLGINISAVAEMGIINYIKELEKIERASTSSNNDNTINDYGQSNVRKSDTKDKVGLLRFELKSMAPEATRIPSYPTSPILEGN